MKITTRLLAKLKNRNHLYLKIFAGFAIAFLLYSTLCVLLERNQTGVINRVVGFTSRLLTVNNPARLDTAKGAFSAAEQPKFVVLTPQKNNQHIDKSSVGSWENGSEVVIATLTKKDGSEALELEVGIKKDDQGKFSLTVPQQEAFTPGDYHLEVKAKESFLYVRNLRQDFSWGVLAVNTNKSIYSPGEEAKIAFGVLNKHGSTICNAKIEITIADPDQNEKTMSSEKDDIKHSPDCGNNYSEIPDYLTSYNVGEPGRYLMKVTANNGAGKHSITDFFDVKDTVPFTIERVKFPTRIYPPSGYPVELKVTAHEDYKGKVFDTVPTSFVISDISGGGSAPFNPEIKKINPTNEVAEQDLETWSDIPKLSKTLYQDSNSIVSADHHKPMPIEWDVDWKEGKTYTLSYTINFPKVSPEYYLIGPFIIGDKSFNETMGAVDPGSDSKSIVMDNATLEKDPDIKFFEVRQWQIASDASKCWSGAVDANWTPGAGNNWVTTAGAGTTISSSDVAFFDSSTTTCSSGSTNADSTINSSFGGSIQAIRILTYTGTITQARDVTITTGGANLAYTQSASGSTFNGATQDITMTNSAADFHHTNGAFRSTSGTFTVPDNFTNSGGTFDANSGTFLLTMADGAITVTGSTTFNNLSFSSVSGGPTVAISSGTVLTTNGTLTFESCCGSVQINGPGDITAKGDIATSGVATTGDGTAVITINGTGTQTITGDDSATNAILPSIVVDKPSGTLNLAETIIISGDWTHNNGIINPGSSTVVFTGDAFSGLTHTISGSTEFNNLTFYHGCCSGGSSTISSGTVLNVLGDFALEEGSHPSNINGPGTINVFGDFNATGAEGDAQITLMGSGDQTITQSGGGFSAYHDGALIIAKGGGTASLATAFTMDESGQDLTITSGVFKMGNFNLTLDDTLTIDGQLNQGTGNLVTGSSGEITVGSAGIWVNNSTGDVRVGHTGSGVSNSGYIRLDGGGAQCGDSDSISIDTTLAGTARDWSGAGTYIIIDATVRDANDSGITITAYSSSLTSNSDWVFNGTCPTYSNREETKIQGGVTIQGGTKIQSN